MKHKVVESMARLQFNIPEAVDVAVTFLSSDGNYYDFEIEWWEGESIRHQCSCRLPHLSKQTQDMAT